MLKPTYEELKKRIDELEIKEKELKASEIKCQILFEQASEAIFLISPEGKFVDVNRHACKYLGYTKKELLKLSVSEISIHYPRNKFLDVINILKNQSSVTIETEQKRKNGTIFPVEIRSSIIEMDEKPYLLSMVRDITERKKSEEQILKLSTAIEQTGDNVIITDKDGIIEYVNKAFVKLTGISRKKAIGKTPRILRPEMHDGKFYKELWDTILQGKIFRGVLTNRKKNGGIFYEETTITPIKDSEGNITNFLSIGKDITEKKLAEEKLRVQENRFRKLYNKTPIMLHSIDKSRRLIGVSDYWCKKMGYKRKEILGRKATDFLTEESKQYAEKITLPNFFKTGYAKNIEYKFRTKNGNEIDVLLTAFSENNEYGDFVQSYAVSNDVSELKIAELERAEALVLAEKATRLTSLSTLAAGISHEINQPLTAIKIRVDGLLLLDLTSKSFKIETIKEHLGIISEQITRVDEIINQLRILAGNKEITSKEEVNINKTIKSSLLLIQQRALSRGIKLNLNLRKDVPDFFGNRTSMQQVIINLLSNAMDVLEKYNRKNKRIDISTSYDDNECKIEVRDNGAGIKDEDLDNIFDPFFTKKKSGEGMGIGLAITKQIIKSFGGRIEAKNNIDKGASFTVTIPVK